MIGYSNVSYGMLWQCLFSEACPDGASDGQSVPKTNETAVQSRSDWLPGPYLF